MSDQPAIQRPEKVTVAPEEETSYLQFARGARMSDGEYWMRGGVTWPTATPVKGRPVVGYALLAGMNVKTNKTYIFETQRFLTIEHVLDKNNSIEYEGAVTFFRNAWHHYLCDTFYWNQPDYLHQRYAREVWESSIVVPDPHFVEVHMPNVQASLGPVLVRAGTGQLLWNASNEPDSLHAEMGLYQVEPNPTLSSVAALGTCISGMDKFPYRVSLDDEG